MAKNIRLTPNMDDETKILITFLEIAPKSRLKVFKTFKDDKILRPKQISEITNINLNSVGKALKQLNEKNLVSVLNPNVRANRNFQLTKKGKDIRKFYS